MFSLPNEMNLALSEELLSIFCCAFIKFKFGIVLFVSGRTSSKFTSDGNIRILFCSLKFFLARLVIRPINWLSPILRAKDGNTSTDFGDSVLRSGLPNS